MIYLDKLKVLKYFANINHNSSVPGPTEVFLKLIIFLF